MQDVAPPSGRVVALPGGWFADPAWWAERAERLAVLVDDHAASHPESPGFGLEAARTVLGLPDRGLVAPLAAHQRHVEIANGELFGRARVPRVPIELQAGLEAISKELATNPYQAPDAARLTELGLSARALSTLSAAGALVHVGAGVYLLPGSLEQAARLLAGLPQPFTASQARQALGSTRRVTLPLLELLDRRRITIRHPDSSRQLRQ